MGQTRTDQVLVFRAVRAIDPLRQLDALVDVVVAEGRIERVGPQAAESLLASPERLRVIEGRGRWLIPSLVEMHAHLREPGQEYKEDIASGLRAAAAGGYGHLCAMANTVPVNDTRAVTEYMVARAEQAGGPALHPISAITMGLEGKDLVEMADQKEAGVVAVSDDGRCVVSSAVMRHALDYARNFDLLVIQHAEDHALTQGAQMHEGFHSTRLGLRGWPRVAEDIIVARDLLLAEVTGARYHIAHLSSQGAVRLLREAKSRGLSVSAEVTPHHLLLDDSMLGGYDPMFKVNPPLREVSDQQALRQALADGTIDCVATDHAPHSSLEKRCEFAECSPGMIGLETALALMLGLVRDGTMRPERLVQVLSQSPARLIGLPAPSICEGQPAELCLVDPEHVYELRAEMLHSKSKNSPFIGWQLQGRVDMTMAQGLLCYERTPSEAAPHSA